MKCWLTLFLCLALQTTLAPSASAQSRGQAAYEPPRLADGKPDLNGMWQAPKGMDANLESKVNGKNIIVDPPNGKIPWLPAAQAGRKERAQTKPAGDPLIKCYLPGVPRFMYIAYPFQIAQDSEQFAMLSEFVHSIRHIYLKRQKHLPDIDFWMGDRPASGTATRSWSTPRT